MFAFSVGSQPPKLFCAAFVRMTASFALLALAGCASNPDHYASHGQQPPTQVAHAVVVEVEDDGLPSQAPPPVRIRDIPDDPSEPFSKNYGGTNPSGVPEIYEKVTTPPEETPDVVRSDLPVVFRQKVAAAHAADE
ncbi:MAG: adhesin [Hyphomicrobium sp.]|nr:MAG: adhesin [Hyphomicrobium sp.]